MLLTAVCFEEQLHFR